MPLIDECDGCRYRNECGGNNGDFEDLGGITVCWRRTPSDEELNDPEIKRYVDMAMKISRDLALNGIYERKSVDKTSR